MDEILGQIIKKIAEERNLNARTLGEKINKTKQGTSSIFKRDVIDSDLLMTLSDTLDYDFVTHLYNRPALRRFKQKEIEDWQAKIDAVNEEVGRLKAVVDSKSETIKGLEDIIQYQSEIIRLLKEKEEFLSVSEKNKS